MKRKFSTLILVLFVFIIAGNLVFGQMADLKIRIKCPGKAEAGQDLKQTINVYVTNTGKVAAKNFPVDLIISKDASAPMQYAVYSAVFKEDALLLGGREFVPYLGPGQTKAVKLYGNNRVPADTPTGAYFLGAIVDAGNKVRESNERNNMDFCRLKVKGKTIPPEKKIIDIDITDIYLDKHCRIWIKHTNNGSDKLDVILREKVWVDGRLVTDDTERIVLLPGKSFAHGVGADPGVIAIGTPRVKAQIDVDGVLTETNEMNNIKVKVVRCPAVVLPAVTPFTPVKPLTPTPVAPVAIPYPNLIKKIIKIGCPDPAAFAIIFKIVNRFSTFTGKVRITGVIKNVGSKAFSGGGGMAYLYEGNTLRKTKNFSYIAPGTTISLFYERNWNSSSPSEGEFPPKYKLVILYDPDILMDGNKNNDDCKITNNRKERSGSGINSLFR